jgi:hypothetical protein
MDRPARLTALLQYLRITFLVGCSILCLLLIVLWVRSYWWIEYASVIRSKRAEYVVSCDRGRIVLSGGFTALQPGIRLGPKEVPIRFRAGSVLGYSGPVRWVSCWLATMTTAAVVALTWIRWRFSLRTLLVAATLVAVGLGVVVMMLKGS